MALTLGASRRRVIATDDEVVAGREFVVDLAQSKGRNGNDPNNRRGATAPVAAATTLCCVAPL
jgi:hypothetical protein